jgi:hypothetical protein
VTYAILTEILCFFSVPPGLLVIFRNKLIFYGEELLAPRQTPKMEDLRKIGWNGIDWIDLAQDRDQWRDLVNTVMNLRVP